MANDDGHGAGTEVPDCVMTEEKADAMFGDGYWDSVWAKVDKLSREREANQGSQSPQETR